MDIVIPYDDSIDSTDDEKIKLFLDNKFSEFQICFNVIKKYNLDDIICIDESSLSTSLKYNYCRSKLGDRCIIKTDDNSVFKKYSYISAITNKECINSKLYDEGSVNAERFNVFLMEICDKVNNKLFILDNGQIHKKEETKKIRWKLIC